MVHIKENSIFHAQINMGYLLNNSIWKNLINSQKQQFKEDKISNISKNYIKLENR